MAKQINYLETERLILRKLKAGDEVAMFNGWCSDPEVTKYVTWSVHKDISVTKALLDMWLKQYDDPKTERFGIVLKQTNELIGAIDVVDYINGVPEIGYTISRKYWNQGYMTEACKAFINYLFSRGYEKLTIEAEVNNIGSNRVIQKCGFKYLYQGESKNTIVNWYEIEAPR